jgi:hypothetical protein
VAQIVVEFPLEHAQSAISMFGVPTPSTEQWVAIAALESVRSDPEIASNNTLVQQAAMLCNSPSFQEYLVIHMNAEESIKGSSASTADALRRIIGASSRSEIATNEEVRLTFNRLKGEYDQWLMSKI